MKLYILIISLKFYTIIAAIFLILFLDGCSTATKPIPEFVLNTPVGNTNTIYGVGVGETFMEAKADALNDIALSMKADVRSISLTKKSTNTGTEFSKHITIVTKRDIGNYQITKDVVVDDKFYLLLKYNISLD